ncbi:metallophosphoesterase [Thalassococcus sp. S3]|uniref:metallophosphoesterase n=1 Tax=Thalassococcus sp. S3 TaxID=2017482 RepID=UPI0013EE99B0|nr:metallophosphoesterase [Thalassococcus sp. S3]
METLTIPFDTGRVVILGDLHLDSYDRLAVDPIAVLGLEFALQTADALILAGDLINGPASNWSKVFDNLAQHILPEKVYAFPGNHDYYNGSLGDDPLLEREAAKAGAHFVQERVLRHGTTRFLCCTLWTDFDLLGDQQTAMSVAQQLMRDYSRIVRPAPRSLLIDDNPVGWIPQPWIKPEDVLMVHQDHCDWLGNALSQSHHVNDTGQTVVVTHHGPHPDVAGAIDALTPSFHSDLSDLIADYQPDSWFFGHSHRRLRARIEGTDIRNVSIGYA